MSVRRLPAIAVATAGALALALLVPSAPASALGLDVDLDLGARVASDVGVDDGGIRVDLDYTPSNGALPKEAVVETAKFPLSTAVSALVPEMSPPGANDFSCVPDAAHPVPVVLVHGTFENAYSNWVQLSDQLTEAGYCVYALNYGGIDGSAVKGLGDIPTSAGQLAGFVDVVLAETGAPEVDIVGHSQGGMMPRYYIQELGGEEKVRRLVGLASSNQGTSFLGVLPVVAALPGGERVLDLPCAACVQQRAGSDFLTELNRHGDTRPGVEYTVISTVLDEVVTPYTRTFLTGDATNITLQEQCALDLTDHLGISYDPVALRLVENALTPETAQRPLCQPVLPVLS